MPSADTSAAVRDDARPHSATPRLFKKKVADDVPIDGSSMSLFRFGEQCNYRCPMCSNTGDPALFFHPTEALLDRATFLHELGFRRVMLTGGEATIHPGFWTVVERLVALDMRWDINTHGRSFAEDGFAQRAVASGLGRAIVSLHSFDPAASAEIFGMREKDHHASVAGVHRLVDAGVGVMLNCVLSRLNLDHLEDYVRQARAEFGAAIRCKIVFPTTIGKGGKWPAIASLRYADVRERVLAMQRCAKALDLDICFESFPNCILGDPAATNVGRSGFGESHYLDDADGRAVYSMRHIEAELSVYGEPCRRCIALPRCPGVARTYAQHHGIAELVAFGEAAAERAHA